MKIILLHGGISPEREISLRSSVAIATALRALKHDLKILDPTDFTDMIDLVSEIRKQAPDLVFIGLHGGGGENGILQAHLEEAGIRFTGSGHKASAISMDKHLSTQIVDSLEIDIHLAKVLDVSSDILQESDMIVRTPLSLTISKDALQRLSDDEIVELMSDWVDVEIDWEKGFVLKHDDIQQSAGIFPVVVKPNAAGSSVGTHIVKDRSQLRTAIDDALNYDDTVIIQEFIAGRELTVGIVGDKVLPVVEIKPTQGFYDYKNKYTKGNTEYICPALLNPDETKTAQFFAEIIYKSIGCKDYGRVDFIYDGQDFFFLEVNTLPGMTELSLLPQAAKQAGIDFIKLVEMIINDNN